MSFIERLEHLCEERKISKRMLEKEAKLSNGITSKWKGDSLPNQTSLLKISKYFGVSIDYLTGKSDFKTEDEILNDYGKSFEFKNGYRKGVRIPVLGDVAAGIPIDAIEDILDWEEISEDLAKTGQYFGLRIKGDSMSPRIADGDVVIVRQQCTAECGDIVIAKVNGDTACCKKFLKLKDGITLVSFNPAYNPMIFTNSQINSMPVNIIGKVVELRAKF